MKKYFLKIGFQNLHGNIASLGAKGKYRDFECAT